MSDLSLSLSQLMNPSLYFISPVQLWRGMREALVGAGHPARVNPLQSFWCCDSDDEDFEIRIVIGRDNGQNKY